MTRSPITCLDGTVTRIQDLGPTFRRITFSGPGMADFGFVGPALDLRLKLVIPPPGTCAEDRFDLPAFMRDQEQDAASWYQAWLRVPEERRGAMRTYSVRDWRPEERELDVDMVLHVDAAGASGPAASWAQQARLGDRVHIIGPHREWTGENYAVEFLPGAARDLLIAGDETAAPAICSILGALPADAGGVALIEVPDERDVQDVVAPDGMDVRWLVRGGEGVGTRLDPAVRAAVRTPLCAESESSLVHRAVLENDLEDVDVDATILWDVPARLTEAAHASASGGGVTSADGAGDSPGDASGRHRFYAWIAGEAGVVKTLRRYLVREVGVDRHQVAFMGYWRQGCAEG